MKNFDGATKLSSTVFDYLEVWVRVKDLLLNKITHIFARHLGDWLEEIATVDVEKHG